MLRGRTFTPRVLGLKAIQLSPQDPRQWFAEMLMAFSLLLQDRAEEALSVARKGRTARPDNTPLAMALAWSLAVSGQVPEARAITAEIVGRNPAMRLATLPKYAVFQRAQDMRRFVEGMSLAGLPA